MEGFLEEARIKLSSHSHVSDLPGLSGRLMLQALAAGETNPARIAAVATQGIEKKPCSMFTKPVRDMNVDQAARVRKAQ